MNLEHANSARLAVQQAQGSSCLPPGAGIDGELCSAGFLLWCWRSKPRSSGSLGKHFIEEAISPVLTHPYIPVKPYMKGAGAGTGPWEGGRRASPGQLSLLHSRVHH